MQPQGTYQNWITGQGNVPYQYNYPGNPQQQVGPTSQGAIFIPPQGYNNNEQKPNQVAYNRAMPQVSYPNTSTNQVMGHQQYYPVQQAQQNPHNQYQQEQWHAYYQQMMMQQQQSGDMMKGNPSYQNSGYYSVQPKY